MKAQVIFFLNNIISQELILATDAWFLTYHIYTELHLKFGHYRVLRFGLEFGTKFAQQSEAPARPA